MILALAETTQVSFPGLGIDSFEMNRFLVKDLFGNISVAWYGFFICVAMILACTLILRNAVKKENLNGDSFLDYFLITIPLGVVGARCMYVLTNLDYYDTFSKAVAIWNGGLAIYGGVIVGFVTVIVIAKIKKHNPLRVLDAVMPGLMLAQAIGRWGNFVNGEAHGTLTDLPWGMTINGAGPFHPTFLYESLLTFTGFLLAQFWIYKIRKFPGTLVCFYAVWYGIGRTLIEGLRTDSLYFGALRASQVIGSASAVLGAVLFVILYKRYLNAKCVSAEPVQSQDNAKNENGEGAHDPT